MHRLLQKNGQPFVSSTYFFARNRQKNSTSVGRSKPYHRIQLFALVLLTTFLLRGDESASIKDPVQPPSNTKFVQVKPGTFVPRKTLAEERHAENIQSLPVKISRPFLISPTEVTNFQMVSMLKRGLELDYIEANRAEISMPTKRGESKVTLLNYQNSDIKFSNGQLHITPGKEQYPCTGVTWYGAQIYANLYSLEKKFDPAIDVSTWSCDFTGKGFRLPTESEWEYACLAGRKVQRQDTPASGPKNTSQQADEIHQVGSKPFNPWGLSDMDGNVSEWCWDWFGSSRESSETDPSGPSKGWRRVLRGRNFANTSQPAHTAVRISGLPFNENRLRGFRIVRTVSETNQN